MKLKHLRLCLTVAGVLCASGIIARASTIPLASFAQNTPGATPFVYSNPLLNVPDATISVLSTSVTFIGLSCGLPTDANARLTMDGARLSDAINVGGSGLGAQVFDPVHVTIKNAAGTITYLDMVSTGFNFYTGTLGGTSTGLTGSDPGGGATIVYSSTVAGVSAACLNGGDKDYSLSMASLTTPFAIDASIVNNDVVSHNASISGVFGATASVPEPGAVAALMGVGVAASLFRLRLRRR